MNDSEKHLIRFAALQDARALIDDTSKPEPSETLAVSRIVAYANRKDTVVDLSIERVLRQNSRARHIHWKALAGLATGRSEVAVAAAGGSNVFRAIDGHQLELISEAGTPYLVIRLAPAETRISAVEVRTPDGHGGRVSLGAAMEGIVQLRLDLSRPEQLAFRDALLMPDSSIFLL